LVSKKGQRMKIKAVLPSGKLVIIEADQISKEMDKKLTKLIFKTSIH